MESGEKGVPAATDTDSILGKQFSKLAENVIEAVNIRNDELPPTEPVQITRK